MEGKNKKGNEEGRKKEGKPIMAIDFSIKCKDCNFEVSGKIDCLNDVEEIWEQHLTRNKSHEVVVSHKLTEEYKKVVDYKEKDIWDYI